MIFPDPPRPDFIVFLLFINKLIRKNASALNFSAVTITLSFICCPSGSQSPLVIIVSIMIILPLSVGVSGFPVAFFFCPVAFVTVVMVVTKVDCTSGHQHQQAHYKNFSGHILSCFIMVECWRRYGTSFFDVQSVRLPAV